MKIFFASFDDYFGKMFLFFLDACSELLGSSLINEVFKGSAISVIKSLNMSLHPWWIFGFDKHVIKGNEIVKYIE